MVPRKDGNLGSRPKQYSCGFLSQGHPFGGFFIRGNGRGNRAVFYGPIQPNSANVKKLDGIAHNEPDQQRLLMSDGI
jgi:hypothetical protein